MICSVRCELCSVQCIVCECEVLTRVHVLVPAGERGAAEQRVRGGGGAHGQGVQTDAEDGGQSR